jgi:hypothetical protein
MQQPLQSEKGQGELKRKMQPEQQPLLQSEKRKRQQSEKHHGQPEKRKEHCDMSFDQVLDALYKARQGRAE